MRGVLLKDGMYDRRDAVQADRAACEIIAIDDAQDFFSRGVAESREMSGGVHAEKL